MIEKQHLDHLSNQIEQANLILFTGAGFSLSLKNKDGKNLPTGAQLAASLWGAVRPDIEFDGSSLEDVFGATYNYNKRLTGQHLKEIFNMDTNGIPDWYAAYTNQPWFKVYTLNVDNFWRYGLSKFNSKRGLTLTSATTSKSVIDKGESPINIVHLNGTYDEIPDHIVFSLEQYSKRLTEFDYHYINFASEFATKSVVFIGTQIDESSFWKHIQLRKSKSKEDGHRELRPRSYLVSPTISAAKKSLLSEYNVVHLPIQADQFAHLLNELVASTAKGLVKIDSELKANSQNNKLCMVNDLVELDSKLVIPSSSDFLLGAEPRWKDIADNKTIFRSFEDEISACIDKSIKIDSNKDKVILLSGTAGDGKSTTAMRVALRYFSDGKKVVWVDYNRKCRPTDVVRQLSDLGGVDLLVIDNTEIYTGSISQILNTVLNEKLVKAVLLTVRSSKADHIINKDELYPYLLNEVSTTKLKDEEILNMLKVLEEKNKLGVLLNKPREFQLKAFKDKADSQLIVALIEATSGKAFNEKIIEEYENLEGASKFIYLTFAMATHFRAALTKEDLLIVSRITPAELLNTVDNFVKRGLLTPKQNGNFQLRHRIISDRIADDISEKGTGKEVLLDLGFISGLKVSQHESLGISRSPYKDLLIKSVNHETLMRMLGKEETPKMYAELEDTLKIFSHYWLQRGRFEIENGNLSNARLFLSHAKALNPNDDYVETAEAHLEFKSAWQNPSASDSLQKVENCVRRLEIQIITRGKLSPYPFHILGSSGYNWFKYSSISREDKIAFLGKISAIVEAGVKLHSSDKSLLELHTQLKKEYLSSAVKR